MATITSPVDTEDGVLKRVDDSDDTEDDDGGEGEEEEEDDEEDDDDITDAFARVRTGETAESS